MGEDILGVEEESRVYFEHIEQWVRMKIQGFIQELLEEEVDAFLGRGKHERSRGSDDQRGFRNGYCKQRNLSLTSGTVVVRRPRVRDTEQRFESRILPLFQRRSRQVGELLPALYLHGLSKGDFELALRGLLGDGAPLCVSSIQRLKGQWEAEYSSWSKEDLSELELVYLWADGLYVKAGIGRYKAGGDHWGIK